MSTGDLTSESEDELVKEQNYKDAQLNSKFDPFAKTDSIKYQPSSIKFD